MRYKYYTNLKNQIKILRKLINIIIKLDNQLYKYRLEKNLKREKYIPQERPQFDHQSRNYQSYGDPIELDTIKQ